MKELHQIDPNFALPAVETEGIVFHDVRTADVDFYGLYRPLEAPEFCRMPQNVADAVSDGVAALNHNTAGGRLRFCTNSRKIVVSVRQTGEKDPSPHHAFINTAGFDLYVVENGRQRFWSCMIPPIGRTNGYEAQAKFPTDDMREFVLNFPTFDGVLELSLGLEEGAALTRGGKYRLDKPVVFYGSSITQGACASRPGNIYENILSRRLDIDYTDLGFSGRARGEKAMAEYIAALPAAAYVVDYDHNAPTVDHLEATHEPFVRILREKNPLTPILLISRPNHPITPIAFEKTPVRRQIIRSTYEKLVAEGDRNIYFLDGQTFFEKYGDCCIVDGVHPNDLGMVCMADGIEPILRRILFVEE